MLIELSNDVRNKLNILSPNTGITSKKNITSTRIRVIRIAFTRRLITSFGFILYISFDATMIE